MEKKTILAFVLSFIILVLWSYLFGPQKDPAPRQDQESGQEQVVDKGPAQQASEVSKAPDVAPPVSQRALEKTGEAEISKKVDEKKIEIDTPLYRAVFTNAGPTLKSFKLKGYRETTAFDSPFIELAGLGEEMGEVFLIKFDALSGGKDEKISYKADNETLRLGPESSHKDLVFRAMTPTGLSINQTFRFYPDQYKIDLEIDVTNRSGSAVKGVYRADIKALPPKEKKGYYSFVGLAILLDDKLEELEIEEPSESDEYKGRVEWMAYEDEYFISAIIPEAPKGSFRGRLLSSGVLNGRYMSPPVSLGPSAQISSRYTLYFGPRDLAVLKGLNKNLDRAVNFGWTDIIARPLLYLLHFFNQYIHNYGVSIIVLTILIKILFWPLTHKSYKSMKEMQKLQPRMAKLREKYKDNKQQLNKEMMALYKTYKVNPMGGCLPMIIQIPVFFALFRLLGSAIELRHAPFMLWIKDLSAPDRLFNFPFTIPLMDPPYGIPVLTLLMGASMFIQQKMTPTPGDPTQAKIMMFLPIIFTFLFINFPSGLVLYWLVNNILSIGQQYRIHRSPA